MKLVLVVEDDAWQGEHFQQQLEQAGYQVRLAAHANQAMELIDQTKPDVILLDLFLPGVNGIALLHEIQSHADLASVPVIICSTTPLELPILRPYGVQTVLDKTTLTNAQLAAAVGRLTT